MKPTLIFGPPGTGKTTRLIEIVDKELTDGVRPNEIAYCSFTREGSDQGRKRAMEKFNCARDSLPYFRTLHSLAFQALQLQRHQVMSQNDYRRFSKKMGMNLLGFYTEDLTNNDDKYLFYNDIYRNNPKAAQVYLDDLDSDKLAYVMKGYKEFKKIFAKYDYTDMISNFVTAHMEIPVKVAIIDEAQDLTSLQWKMVWLAFRSCERMYIAGDDDQAIYQWSGADVDHFLGVQGNVEILHQSWRLPKEILEYSKLMSSQISKRVDKEYKGTDKPGAVIHVNSVNEIPINGEETYMFLSRNNVFLDEISESLMRKKVIFSRKGEPSISTSDVKAIKTYEKVRKERIMTDENRAELKPYLVEGYSFENPWFDSFNWESTKSDYVRDLIANKTPIGAPKILVSTIHSVKGGEADNVAVLSEVTKSVNENIARNPDSEHRVFYVGCTRAKKNLYIVHSDAKYNYPIF